MLLNSQIKNVTASVNVLEEKLRLNVQDIANFKSSSLTIADQANKQALELKTSFDAVCRLINEQKQELTTMFAKFREENEAKSK